MDHGALIKLVRQYEHLYDKKHKEFKNKLARENAWNTISSIMGYSREEVETTWISLRNRFATERRKIRCIPSGSGARTEWRYYTAMLFLEDHVAIRKTVGNIKKPNLWDTELISNVQSCEIDEGSQQLLETANDAFSNEMSPTLSQSISTPLQAISTPSYSLNPSPSQSNSTENLLLQPSSSSHSVSSPSQQHKLNINQMKQNKRKRNNDIEKSIAATLSTIENIVNSSDENNEDMLFARSIGESLKLIKNRKIKSRVKIKLLSVLEKYEGQD